MEGSEFVLDYVHILYYKCYKINSNRGATQSSNKWAYPKSVTRDPRPGTHLIGGARDLRL